MTTILKRIRGRTPCHICGEIYPFDHPWCDLLEKLRYTRHEQLPVGTEFSVILRVREGSPITKEVLTKLLSMGKSNGLGAWRSSGSKGRYFFKIEELKDYKEPIPEGRE